MRACLLHCMRVRLRNGYTEAYAQIIQHTHTHKVVTRHVEARKLLSRRRYSNYRVGSNFRIGRVTPIQQLIVLALDCLNVNTENLN